MEIVKKGKAFFICFFSAFSGTLTDCEMTVIMDDRELRKLSRQDLLEMLVELSRENEKLKNELDMANKKLQSRRIRIEEAGNIAEASLRLNNVFESAQAAATQYLENLEALEKKKQQELEKVRELRKKLNEKEDA